VIGIVILNYNTPDDVLECVESIRKGTSVDYKIYVVDNCSTDGSYKLLQEKYENEADIVVLESDRNGGYSYGNNIGIKRACDDSCDYILISNPDIVYFDKAIDTMYDTLVRQTNVAVVGPSTPSLDQDESQLLRKVYRPQVYFFSKKPFLYLSKIFHDLKTEFDYPQDMTSTYCFEGMVRGCCFLIPSRLFSEIGFFDDNVFLYSEEWIIAKKIADRGLLCAFEPKAKALHKEATSTKQVGTGFRSFHLYLSSYYYLKYYSGCGKGYLVFTYLQNLLSYMLKSVTNQSYRKLLHSFVVSQTELFLGKKRKIGYNSMM